MPEGKSPAIEALDDAKSLSKVLDTDGAAKAYEELNNKVDNAKFTGKDASAYYQTLSQTLERNGVLPALAVNFLEDKAPKSATGEIIKENSADGNDLTTKNSELLKNNFKDSKNAVERKFLTYSINNFDTLAGKDGNKSTISQADLAALKKDQKKP